MEHHHNDQAAPSRSLSWLDATGDTTITWTEDEDDAMLDIIQRKMDAGVTFYIVPQRKPGQRGRVAAPKKLKKPSQALAHRALSIPDADFSKFVLDGKGKAVPSHSLETERDAKGALKTVRRAKTAREVAQGHSIAHAPRQGG